MNNISLMSLISSQMIPVNFFYKKEIPEYREKTYLIHIKS